MLIYGIVAAVQAGLPVIIFIFTTITPPGWAPIRAMVYVLMGCWTPFFMAWLGVVLFDSSEARNLMYDALHISLVGPFLLYWVGFADMFMEAQWTNWVWYTVMALSILYSLASICYQAIFFPKVTQWIAETPIKIYSVAQEIAEEAEAAPTEDPATDETAATEAEEPGVIDEAEESTITETTETSSTDSTDSTDPISSEDSVLAIAF